MKLTDLLKEAGIEMGKVYTDKDRPPFKTNEAKTHTISRNGTIVKYKVGDNVILHMKDGKKVKGKIIGLKNTGRIRLKTKYKKAVGGGPGSDKFTTDKKDVKKVVIEGKLTEAKESIFDVAAKVMKDQQNYNYKSKKGMVKLDMQTANLLTKVWKKVNPKMKKHLAGMGESNPAGLVQTLWAAVK